MTFQLEKQSNLTFVQYTRHASAVEMYSSPEVVIDQLFELSKQSEYGPSRQSLSDFISDFSTHNNGLEKEGKLLFVGLDEHQNAVGFLQARFFEDTADLDFVVVDRIQRRKGSGKRLLELLERELQGLGVSRIILEVAAGNQNALQLYENFGYKKISVRKSYYRTGEDALVMEKTI